MKRKIILIHETINPGLCDNLPSTLSYLNKIAQVTVINMKSIHQNNTDKPVSFRNQCTGNAIFLYTLLQMDGYKNCVISYIQAKKYVHYFVSTNINGLIYALDPFTINNGSRTVIIKPFDKFIENSKWELSYVDEPKNMIIGNLDGYNNINNEIGWEETVDYIKSYIVKNKKAGT